MVGGGTNEGVAAAPPAPAPIKLSELHAEAYRNRERVAVQLEQNKGHRRALEVDRAVKRAEIERLQRELVEVDAALASFALERDDLVAMETALAEQQAALERALIRRSYE